MSNITKLLEIQSQRPHRTEMLSVRMTTQELNHVKKLAESLNITLSHAVRHILLKVSRMYEEENKSKGNDETA